MNMSLIVGFFTREWSLRSAFWESSVQVGACVGGRGLEEYLVPLMVQALSGALN